MDIIKCKKNFENDFIPFSPNGIHTESDMFLYDNDLIKVFKKKIHINKQDTILSLDKIDINECVIPKYVFRYGTNVVGYGMDFYKDYNSLYSLINNESLSYNERLNIAIKLYQIIMYLDNKGICFHDIHSGNFLYLNNDIKVIDMDSVIDSNIYGRDCFNYNMKLTYLRLARLCFSLLLNERIILPFEINSEEISDIINYFEGNKREFFKYVFGFDVNNISFIDTINEFNEEDFTLIRKYLD